MNFVDQQHENRVSSNRTSMELKRWRLYHAEQFTDMPSNRTSMELKLCWQCWQLANCLQSSNRTSMELKRDRKVPQFDGNNPSNRTSMELKPIEIISIG